MSTFKCLTNKDSGKVGENERLDKGNHYFDQVNEYSKCNAKWRKSPACNCAHGPKNKNQCDETEDDDMSRNHVGEKTYNQGEWLGEYTQQFNRKHDENPHRGWNTGEPKNMTPKMLIGAEKNHKKRNDTQYNSKCNVTGNIR